MMKNMNKFALDLNDYELVRKINQGGFAKIFLVRDKKTNKEYVAKENMLISTEKEESNLKTALREIQILMDVKHPTIIPMIGFSFENFYKENMITVIMEYMEKGSLAKILLDEQKGLLEGDYNNTNRQIILIGIAKGMSILHSKNIMHRDLKPENILIDHNLEPKITDFGLSKYLDLSLSQSQHNCGTLFYISPEVIESNHYDKKADVYSFGILMYEIITAMNPYPKYLNNNFNEFSFKSKILGGMRPSFGIGLKIKEELIDLMKDCWDGNPSKRPSFQEIYQKLSSNETYFLPDVDDDIIKDYVDSFEDDRENDEETENKDMKQDFIADIKEMRIDLLMMKEQLSKASKRIEYLSEENKQIKNEMKNEKEKLINEKEAKEKEMINVRNLLSEVHDKCKSSVGNEQIEKLKNDYNKIIKDINYTKSEIINMKSSKEEDETTKRDFKCLKYEVKKLIYSNEVKETTKKDVENHKNEITNMKSLKEENKKIKKDIENLRDEITNIIYNDLKCIKLELIKSSDQEDLKCLKYEVRKLRHLSEFDKKKRENIEKMLFEFVENQEKIEWIDNNIEKMEEEIRCLKYEVKKIKSRPDEIEKHNMLKSKVKQFQKIVSKMNSNENDLINDSVINIIDELDKNSTNSQTSSNKSSTDDTSEEYCSSSSSS